MWDERATQQSSFNFQTFDFVLQLALDRNATGMKALLELAEYSI